MYPLLFLNIRNCGSEPNGFFLIVSTYIIYNLIYNTECLIKDPHGDTYYLNTTLFLKFVVVYLYDGSIDFHMYHQIIKI